MTSNDVNAEKVYLELEIGHSFRDGLCTMVM